VNLVHRFSEWWRTSQTVPARWLRAAHDALLGEMPIMAAGTALFAIMAVVPALAAVVSVYGLIADPRQIHDHLLGLEKVLPPEVVSFVGDQLQRQAQRGTGELGLQLATSVVFAMYSARGSAAALIDALNRAYRVRELRHPLRKVAITLAIAAATLIGMLLMFAIVVALPALVATVPWLPHAAESIRWPALLALVFGALLALYRFGPTPRPLGTERHLWPGAAIATGLLVLVAWGLSEWVERVASYEVFYGSFGTVIVVVLWFYLSTITLVIGGFVNAELERESGAPAPSRTMY
jgi:membrane protein